jgi:hypothetical protein
MFYSSSSSSSSSSSAHTPSASASASSSSEGFAPSSLSSFWLWKIRERLADIHNSFLEQAVLAFKKEG